MCGCGSPNEIIDIETTLDDEQETSEFETYDELDEETTDRDYDQQFDEDAELDRVLVEEFHPSLAHPIFT